MVHAGKKPPMNIKIRETGKIETLNTIDPKSGTDWTQDLIGNAGAINQDEEKV